MPSLFGDLLRPAAGPPRTLHPACNCGKCSGESVLTTDRASPDMQFLVSETIGPKRGMTPEGFLICFEVPIARVGSHDYAGIELPDLEDKDGVLEVDKPAEVLFSPATIASFEMKPVTLDHPPEAVSPANWMVYSKGTTTNVRQGEGDQNNLLLADLIVMDKFAIFQVQNGLVEVSAGYDAEYKQIAPGRARQETIVGNHIALVKRARCGPVCSIGDSSSILSTASGESTMAVKKPVPASSLMDKLRKAFMTRDSDEFEKTLTEVKDSDEMGGDAQHIHIHMPDGDTKEETKDDADDPLAKIAASIDALSTGMTQFNERLSALETAKTTDSDEKVEEKKEETKDSDEDGDADETMDSDESDKEDKKDEKKEDKKSTNDSAAFRDEFQDAKARAEILAPGVKLPTFDAKAEGKKTADSICVLRRRALRASLDGDNSALVKAITGDSDVSKMTCDSAKAFFNAASELVKQKNSLIAKPIVKTEDSKSGWADINQRNADFWSNRK